MDLFHAVHRLLYQALLIDSVETSVSLTTWLTSCNREPVCNDSHFALLLFRGAAWSSRDLWADCRDWGDTVLVCFRFQLVCGAIQRHALRALLGQPPLHIKVCDRKRGNMYGLQKWDSLVSSEVIRMWKTYYISLAFATLVNHCVIKRRFMGGTLAHWNVLMLCNTYITSSKRVC